MGRLYVDNKYTNRGIGTLREQAPPQNGAKGYFEKVAKLVPSEVIAGFLAMCGFVPTMAEGSRMMTYWIIFGFCLVLTPIYLNYQAQDDKPKLVHLLISTVAFAVWAYVTKGDVLLEKFDVSVAFIVLVAFSLVSAMIPLKK